MKKALVRAMYVLMAVSSIALVAASNFKWG